MVQCGKGICLHHARSGGKDLFVHKSAIEGDGSNSLTEGQKVEYEETAGQKGPQATNVRVLS